MGKSDGIGWERIIILTIIATTAGITADYFGLIDWIAAKIHGRV
jgi:hypothetical protein